MLFSSTCKKLACLSRRPHLLNHSLSFILLCPYFNSCCGWYSMTDRRNPAEHHPSFASPQEMQCRTLPGRDQYSGNWWNLSGERPFTARGKHCQPRSIWVMRRCRRRFFWLFLPFPCVKRQYVFCKQLQFGRHGHKPWLMFVAGGSMATSQSKC